MKKFLLLCLPFVYAVVFYYFTNFIFQPYKSLEQSQILFEKGNKFWRIRAFEEALKVYRQTVELNPQNAVAWFRCGLIYKQQKKIKTHLKCIYVQQRPILKI